MEAVVAQGREDALDVLWLEDDPEFVSSAGRLLERSMGQSGLDLPRFRPQIRHVSTLREARQELGDHTPDVLLADLNVPDSRGSDTLVALREEAPDVPLLVLSGVQSLDSSIEAALSGADFLDKDDLNPERLWRGICMAIMRNSARG